MRPRHLSLTLLALAGCLDAFPARPDVGAVDGPPADRTSDSNPPLPGVDAPMTDAPAADVSSVGDTPIMPTPDGPMTPADGPPQTTAIFWGECDHTVADSCGPGRTCRASCPPMRFFETKCEMPGSKQEGEVCTTSAECGSQLHCLPPDQQCGNAPLVGMCRRYCKTNFDCPAKGSGGAYYCSYSGRTLGGCDRLAPNIGTCSRCDPTGDGTGGCPPPTICTLGLPDRTDCACRAGRTLAAEGGECINATDCAGGLTCLRRGDSSRCRRLCKRAAPNCPSGQTCQILTDHRDYGACLPPTEPPPPVCDPAESGCSVGLKCTLSCQPQSTQAAVACQDATMTTGTRQAGQSCQFAQECVSGTSCVGYGNCTTERQCLRACKDDADCGGASSRCLVELSCLQRPIHEYTFCSPVCDPRPPATAAPCTPGSFCVLYPGEVTTCTCAGADAINGEGKACVITGECLPGFTCATLPEGKSCRPICRLDQPGTCRADQRCYPMPNHKTYGICLPARP